MEHNLPTDTGTELRDARNLIAKVSEWADGMPAVTDAERLANIRRLVRTYERDVLGIVTADPNQPGPSGVQS